MTRPVGPTVPRWQLGKELQRLRTAAGVTYQEMADILGCSDSKIRKIESGDVGVVRIELLAMLDRYGVTEPDVREEFLTLAKQGKQRGWWVAYGQLPSLYAAYIGLETAATSLRNWELAVIPGLAQTAEYARAVNASTMGSASDAHVERMVKIRLERQHRLTADTPLTFWSIIDESAIRREMGSPKVMREQLDHLIELSRLPNVTVQILPFSHGGHPGTLGSFAILDFPSDVHSPVGYTETFGGGGFLESEEDVRRCNLNYQQLTAAALSEKESIKLIAALVKDLT